MVEEPGKGVGGRGRPLVPEHKIRVDGQERLGRTTGAAVSDILEIVERLNVRFLQLQFTDVTGIIKNVEVPRGQFEKALDGAILFDGSSIEGFVREEEADMLLKPDLDTFSIFPWGDADHRVGRLICDVHAADDEPFTADPRQVLKRQIAAAAGMGYTMMVGSEVEFFLFKLAQDGSPTRETHDAGGYFDMTPVDLGEVARRDVVTTLEIMGIDVEAAHHEVAPGQHEVDFRHEGALTSADDLATFRMVVRNVALRHGLHATFMPKPILEQNGSGLHTHQSLVAGGANAFHDPDDLDGISRVMRLYVGGLLEHARGFCAVTNPLVNSYKRLVPGYEAPVHVAWSHQNRSPMIRIPARRGSSTRLELRMPDPAANPYLALAVQLASGLDGLREELEPPEPVDKDIWDLSVRDRRRYKVRDLPRDLGEAITQMKRDRLMRDVLGEHTFDFFVTAKEREWEEYSKQVHDWEADRYLAVY